jgi:RNA polymerase sigma-70 factor (ECF subfamily)
MAEPRTDASLLERFVQCREEAAFVALVRRHGPLVERVCRRVLRNDQDVEDVFQATFLVLARKAAGIPWRDSVSGWLGAVAHRLALNARAGEIRKRLHETTMSALEGRRGADGGGRLPERYHPVAQPADVVEQRDLRRVLDDELLRLPDQYRAPVVLCDIEGRTHEEAARQLGWPSGSMSRRLAHARRLLRFRLARRGVVLALVGLASIALGILGIVRETTKLDRTTLVRVAMAAYKPESEGGQGMGATLAAIVPGGRPLPELDHIISLAREAVRTADVIEALDPGRLQAQWRQYASMMRRPAWELARACEQGNRIAMASAARRLDETCLACHEVFKQ